MQKTSHITLFGAILKKGRDVASAVYLPGAGGARRLSPFLKWRAGGVLAGMNSNDSHDQSRQHSAPHDSTVVLTGITADRYADDGDAALTWPVAFVEQEGVDTGVQ